MEHSNSVLGLSGKLIGLGYNKNLKNELSKVYDECRICLFQMDGIAEYLRHLSYGHQFYMNFVNKWFEYLYPNNGLNYPLCK